MSETPTPPRYGREGEIEARGSSSRVSPRARPFGRYASRTSTRSSIDPGKGSANTNANLDPFRRTNSVPLHGPARLISTADPSNREVSDDAALLSASTCTGASQYTNTPQLLVPTPPKNNHPKTAPFSRARSAGVTNNASGAGGTIVARLSGDPGSDSDDIQVVQRALRRPTTAVSVSPESRRPRSSSPDAFVPTPPRNNHPKTAPFSRARSAGVTNNASGAGGTIVARLSGDPGSDSDDIQVVQRALRRPTTAVSVSPESRRPRSSSPDAFVPTPPRNNHPKTAPFSRARSAGVTNNASGAGGTIVARLSGDPGSDSDDIQVVQRALRRPTTAVSVSPESRRPRSSSPDALRRVCREMRAEGEAKFMSTRHPVSHSSSNTDDKMQERGRRPSIITPLSGFKDWQNAQAQKARASPDRGPIQNRSTISQGRVVGNAAAPPERDSAPQGPLSACESFRRTSSDPGAPSEKSWRPSARASIVTVLRRQVPTNQGATKVADRFDRSSSTGSNGSTQSHDSDSREDTAGCNDKKVLQTKKRQDSTDAHSNWTKSVHLRADASEMQKAQRQLHAIESGSTEAFKGSLWNRRSRLQQRDYVNRSIPSSQTPTDFGSAPGKRHCEGKVRDEIFSRTASAPVCATRGLNTKEAKETRLLDAKDMSGTAGVDASPAGDLVGEQIFVSMAIGDWGDALKTLSALKKQSIDVKSSALSFQDSEGNSLMHIAVMPADDVAALELRTPTEHTDTIFSSKLLHESSAARSEKNSLCGFLGAMERRNVRIVQDSNEMIRKAILERLFELDAHELVVKANIDGQTPFECSSSPAYTDHLRMLVRRKQRILEVQKNASNAWNVLRKVEDVTFRFRRSESHSEMHPSPIALLPGSPPPPSTQHRIRKDDEEPSAVGD